MHRETKVLVIGTGFSGLGMAIELKRRGEHDFVVLEKAADVGGTWRDNNYPGCACDVPSHMYSFSFEPNPELVADVRRASPRSGTTCASVADKYGLRPHIRFDTEVSGARGTTDAKRWRVTTEHGRHLHRPGAGLGHRRAAHPERPGTAGHRELRGQDVPLRAVGPRLRPRPASASPSSAPARRAIQFVPQIAGPGRASWTSTSARRRGSCPSPTARSPAASSGCSAPCPFTQRLYRNVDLLDARGSARRLHGATRS